MGKIKVLSEDVAQKIAAGEVIERPASVVKELIENSIDANAKNILIEIKDGGKKLIKVLDDGQGIASEDVLLAFERHATSKISKLDDIFAVKTLGFRGEALPSIASVSRVTMITRTKEENIGTKCIVTGGKVEYFDEALSKEGCTIIVEDLFFNTPARLKFLKSSSKESAYISEIISKYALGHPEISFKLIIDGREIFTTSGNGNIKEVFAKIYDFEEAKNLIEVEKHYGILKIKAYLLPPQFSRNNRSYEIFFVNGRYIKDKNLSLFLEKGYSPFLPAGKFPVAIIFINIDESYVDVNVHPSKTEIKFKDEYKIYEALLLMIKEALRGDVLIPKEKISINKNFIKEERIDFLNNPAVENKINSINREYFCNFEDKIEKKVNEVNQYIKEFSEFYSTAEIIKNEVVNKSLSKETSTNNFKVIGQIFNTYIIFVDDNNLYILDQHAAHERILYEMYLTYSKCFVIQELVVPHVLKLTHSEMEFFKDAIDIFKKNGFDLDIFDNNSIIIRAIPFTFGIPKDPSYIKEILDELREENFPKDKNKIAASLACHAAIKADEILSIEEMNKLIKMLFETENPYNCPHGRPTIISFSLYELEKKFKRVIS
ncbi:DNA mismatch repair endonuclease MutL [Thermovenabulum gondwanense]|uniref:DNA mismatch repair protein MutL n=1 Tax=Thermovenabulum gondwanense TaxID=520767 RepID=A0A161Q9N0_9FIRM|nr:DNA mismatch repair endonuclease MutL [Thermovenabulum gondwanense]KYO64458.1 DNA mismatch repair protein MutL [Thermovenabulum gondwanense]